MTEAKRYLQFKHLRTGEIASSIDVTGRSEREIERTIRGMLINIGDDWRVHDTAWDLEPTPSTGDR